MIKLNFNVNITLTIIFILHMFDIIRTAQYKNPVSF